MFERLGKIRGIENRFLEPGEFRGDQTIILDGGISWYLRPRWVPGAKHESFMLPAEEAAVPFHRKFGQRVRRALEPCDARRGGGRVGKTLRPFSHKAMEFACVRPVVIFHGCEIIWQAKQLGRQMRTPGPRQPSPEEKRPWLVAETDIRSQIEESLL